VIRDLFCKCLSTAMIVWLYISKYNNSAQNGFVTQMFLGRYVRFYATHEN
jgi:hypothetical protein